MRGNRSVERNKRVATRRRAAWRITVVLILASLSIWMLPASITRRFGDVVQVLVPFQDGVTRSVDAAAQALSDDTAVTSPDLRALQRLHAMVDTLAAQNRRLRGEVETLTRVRRRGLGAQGRLIPARVVSEDAAFWRRSRLLLGGTRRGIEDDAAVLSRLFSVDVSTEDGAGDGAAVLASEVLIGIIDHAGPLTSRVRLLNDPGVRMPVAIGRVEGESFVGPDASFWLVGLGAGEIEIRDVHHRYVNEGTIQVGDTVLTRDDEVTLPPSITIGTITDIAPDRDNPLLYVLKVASPLDLASVRHVYVVDLGN